MERKRCRLSVVESIYFQREGENPRQLPETRKDRWLEGDDHPVVIPLKVGKDWTPVPSLHVERASLVKIVNEERWGGNRIPTKDQLAEIEALVIEVRFDPDSPPNASAVLLPPGDSCRFRPAALKHLQIRCPAGPANCTIAIVPA